MADIRRSRRLCLRLPLFSSRAVFAARSKVDANASLKRDGTMFKGG
jgi:hypothetical protein